MASIKFCSIFISDLFIQARKTRDIELVIIGYFVNNVVVYIFFFYRLGIIFILSSRLTTSLFG